MTELLKQIEQHPIIPIYYNDNIDLCINALDACYDGGVRTFEFVNRGEKALENFKILLEYKKAKYADLNLGIGTIKTKAQAQSFIKIGSDFIVSPIVNEDLADICLAHNTLWIPGCMTPTEIALAEQLNAPLIKLFPGDSLGPNFLKAINPLFPNLKFMPTGGVSLEEANLKAWKAAGVSAVGLGSKLFESEEQGIDKQTIVVRLKQAFNYLS